MTGYVLVATRIFSDYISWPDLTETAVQDAIPTESYGNFGLGSQGKRGHAALNLSSTQPNPFPGPPLNVKTSPAQSGFSNFRFQDQVTNPVIRL
jgi:hypothetical protein